MKILLIGKYPPMQGGISSKTYWLYKELAARGFEFRIVTIETEDYSLKKGELDHSVISHVKTKKIPWHIPESSLISDRIFNQAIEIAETFKPDIIETNYLWPFCMPSALTSILLKKPWLIRHAGSDIQKFIRDAEFKKIMARYFSKASIVITSHTAKNMVADLCGNAHKQTCLRRYIPNPQVFETKNLKRKFDLLFAGKINYRWHLKGLNHLVNLIKHRELACLFVTGGKYLDELNNLIDQMKARDLIEVRNFVHPEQMPSIYNSSKYMWCWQEDGGVPDFSNLVWEALFSGIPCIANKEMIDKFSAEGISSDFNTLIHGKNPGELLDMDFQFAGIVDENLDAKKTALYEDYIQSNINVYQTIV